MARSIYQDRYAVGLQSSLTVADSCTDEIDGSTKSGLLLNDHVDLDTGVDIYDQRKTVGSADRRAGAGAEYRQGLEAPTLSVPFEANAKIMYSFLHDFFQEGSIEQDTANPDEAKWFYPASGNTFPEVWMTVVRDLGSGNSTRFIGGVAESLEINAEEGGNLTLTANLLGYDSETGYTVTNEDFNYSTEALLRWSDAHIQIAPVKEGDVSIPDNVGVSGFSLTLNNGAVAKHFNNRNPNRIILNEFTGSGSFSLPWNSGYSALDDNVMLERFISGDPLRLTVYWDGDTVHSPYPNANGQVSFSAIVRFTGATPTGEDEMMTELPFDLVEYPLFSTEHATISDWTNSDTNELTVTFDTDYGYPYNNIFPGDRIICHDASANSEVLNTIRKVQYTIPIDNSSGSLDVGETIEGGTSGFTAVVIGSTATIVTVEALNGIPADNEEITGGTSGSTADVNFATGSTQAILTTVETAPTDGGSATYASIYCQPVNIGIYDSVDRGIE